VAVCGSNLVVQNDEGGYRFFPARCGCWECLKCVRYRVSNLRTKIIAGEPDMMLTLTWDASRPETPNQAARMMKLAWNLFVKRIKYKTKRKRVPFLAVVEAHKSGYPHFHILLRSGFIDWKWLSETWHELTGAWCVDIRRIHDARQRAHYVTKYFTKAPAKFGNVKRFWCSRDWDRRKPLKPEADWKRAETRIIKGLSVAMMIKLVEDEGGQVIRAGPGRFEVVHARPGLKPPLWACAVTPDAMPKRRKQVWSVLDAA